MMYVTTMIAYLFILRVTDSLGDMHGLAVFGISMVVSFGSLSIIDRYVFDPMVRSALESAGVR